jgi:formate dehydrogenase major subunit
MNAERRIQRVRAALRPAGVSKPDWRIIAEVARGMGARGFAHQTPEEIWDEVRALSPGARGMTYARLEACGLQWPCPAEEHSGTAILHQETFAAGPRAMLQRVEHRPTPEHTTKAYPFLLNTGRSLYQFNAGTMTGRTPSVLLRPEDLLDISPADALALGLQDGDPVRVFSQYGSAVMRAHFSTAVGEGQLFATFHTAKAFVNALTGPNRDSLVCTPEYKVTAVRIETPGRG